MLRNPVTDVASMVHLTDIPDWCYVETVGKDAYADLPSLETLAAMRAASPVAHVDAVRAPVLVLLGAVDLRVPPTNGLRYAAALREREGTVACASSRRMRTGSSPEDGVRVVRHRRRVPQRTHGRAEVSGGDGRSARRAGGGGNGRARRRRALPRRDASDETGAADGAADGDSSSHPLHDCCPSQFSSGIPARRRGSSSRRDISRYQPGVCRSYLDEARIASQICSESTKGEIVRADAQLMSVGDE